MSVLQILQYNDTQKTAGSDEHSGRFLKDRTNILGEPISELCNIYIFSGLLPNDCKIAKLKLCYKKGSKANLANFRPILCLLLISKVLEEVVYDQEKK